MNEHFFSMINQTNILTTCVEKILKKIENINFQ